MPAEATADQGAALLQLLRSPPAESVGSVAGSFGNQHLGQGRLEDSTEVPPVGGPDERGARGRPTADSWPECVDWAHQTGLLGL